MRNKAISPPKNCRLCRARLLNPQVAGSFVFGGSRQQKFYLCPECGVAFLFPPLSKEREKIFYAKEFENFMEKRHQSSNQKQCLRRMGYLKRFIRPRMRVLEIGCSSGFMLLPLKQRGIEVVGVEPSQKFTRFLCKEGVTVFNSMQELEESECGRKKFDLIMHFFVLEHMRDPEDFLKGAIGFLAKKGTMVLEVPSRDDPLVSIYNITSFHKFYWSVAHNYYFNRVSLEYLLKKVSRSFKIINQQRYDLSNHMVWASEGRPGGQGRFSKYFAPGLEKAYKECMVKSGHCDTLVGIIQEKDAR